MRRVSLLGIAALAFLAGCSPAQVGDQSADATSDNASAASPAADKAADRRDILAEPTGPIDPKSPEAAGQVMQQYGALIEQGRWTEAEQYWTDPAGAKQFRAGLDDYPEVHLLIGKPTDMEGAAGSSFITVPTTLDLVLHSGSRSQQSCSATLRRVNDVPGATPKQLRWTIQSIAC